EMPRDIVLDGRIDPRTYRLLSRQAVNEFYVEHAFELVQIDAKTIDMYVVDEFGRRFSKITLYSMVCSRTGYPVGIYVTAGTPSEYSLLKLFEFFFSPKDEKFKDALN
ncbi:TPA: transposase, partial [Pseudomonas aeruginosa]|nr:transposase [Pseudomonas aeruginosa]